MAQNRESRNKPTLTQLIYNKGDNKQWRKTIPLNSAEKTRQPHAKE